MSRPEPHPKNPCGPDCTYRRLYEGGQLSLADMAARQAEALTRLSRVRSGIVQALRHADPDRFAAVERDLGRRLSEADDEVVLRVLDTWTGRPIPAANLNERPVDLGPLRAVLVELGLPLPADDDPSRWAEVLRDHRTRTTADQAASGPVRPAAATSTADDTDGQTLGDLFGDEPRSPVAATAAEAVQTLGDLLGELGETLGDLFDDAPLADSPFDDAPLADSPFDDAPLADSPFDDSPLMDNPLDTVDDQPGSTTIDRAADLLDESFGDLPGITQTTTPATASLPSAPLRPTIPGGRDVKKRTGGRAARVSAVRPDLTDGDNEAQAVAELPDDRADALLAAVTVGIPVFLDDLRAVVPDAKLLAAWEHAMRSDATSPVRFFPAKSRHRELGSLVVPRDYLKDIAGGVRGWWPECVERYRGNRLYELGVLLRRVGSSVVSHRLGEHTVVLRCNDARGLTGMVVVLDPELTEGTEARAEVAAAIDELLRERLTLIAVLAVVETAMSPLETALREEADVRRWTPTMPVALGRSWRWGEAGTADVILGG